MSEATGSATPVRRRRRQIPWTDVITTVAAIVLAFIVGAILMIVSDTEVRSTYAYFFARPSDALIASWDKVSSAYGALIAGSLGELAGDHRDHRPGRAADLRRSRCRARVPGRSVQHRCPGAGHLGRDPGRVRGLHPAPAAGAAPAGGDGRGHHRRRHLGWHRRLAEGPHRCPRGDRDDHDELHRRRPAGLLPHHRGLPAARADRSDLTDHRLERDLPAPRPAASCTSASWSR